MIAGPDHVRRMAAYNRWMNRKVYDVCAGLSADALAEDRGAFFGSVLGTLNHLLFGDVAWLGRFRTGVAGASGPDVMLHEDFATLRAARELFDEEIILWAAGVDEVWLAEPFTYVSGIDGVERTRPTWSLVAHMFNHQTHHRGQLTTLLTQIGLDVGATDIPFMPEEELA